MNVFLLPLSDDFELEFRNKNDGDPLKISLFSTPFTNDNVAALDIENFTGKVLLRRRFSHKDSGTSSPNQHEDRQQQEQRLLVTNGMANNSKVEKDQDAPKTQTCNEKAVHQASSEKCFSESSKFVKDDPILVPLEQPLQEAKSNGSFTLPPKIDTTSDSRTIDGSTASTKSKSMVRSRSSSPSTLSPPVPLSTSLKGQHKWDSKGLIKSLKKPALHKNQSKGYSGLFLRKSIIPQHIRDARNLARSYFYPANDANQSWCNEFGKIVSSPVIMKALRHLSSRDLSEECRRSSFSESNIAELLTPPTKLHVLCAASSINYEDVETELDERPDDASVLDGRMRTPLHVLADNDSLFLEPQGRFTVAAIMARLIQIYPDAITIKDISGRMPFVPLIEDWCIWVYESEEQDRIRRRSDAKSFFNSSEEHGFDQQNVHRRMSMNPVTRAAAQVTVGATRTALAGATKVMKFVDEHINSRVDSMFYDSNEGLGKGLAPKAGRLYPQVKVWDEVYFAFELISEIFDLLAGKNGGIRKIQYEGDFDDDGSGGDDDEEEEDSEEKINDDSSHHRKLLNLDHEARSQFASHLIKCLPYLWKTILLIDDSNLRNLILEMPLFHRLRLVPESIGPWLTNMLRKQGTPAKRAVDFLLMVSETNSTDLTGGFRSDTREDLHECENLRHEIFVNMERLKGTIASLVVLDTKDVERAATSNAVWHLMNRNLTRPFVVGLMLVDIVLHITLMLAVRTSVGLQSTGNASTVVGEAIPAQVALFICTFYIIRKGAEAMALFNLSPTVFRAHVMNMWTILDLLTVILTLCSISWNKRNPGEFRNGFNALVVGLLWLKVLGILKVVNKHMSTFVMAVTKILRDLKYFAIVLFVVVFMVGDMMSIAVATKDDGEFCKTDPENLDETVSDFCSSNQMAAYLRIYALLLGDFELDSYKETSGMVFLFFLFTIIGVVILLNVLIAVIDDSYERAKISGRNLFGRARVEFVALNEALEAFLRPGVKPVDNEVGSATKAFFTLFYIFRWLVLISMISTALNAEIFHASRATVAIKSRQDYFNLIVAVVLFVLLSAGLLVMTIFAFENLVEEFAPGLAKTFFRVFQQISNRCVRLGAWYIFGVREVSIAGVKEIDTKDAEGDEWNGRLNHMEKFITTALIQTKEDIALQIEELEKRLVEKQTLF